MKSQGWELNVSCKGRVANITIVQSMMLDSAGGNMGWGLGVGNISGASYSM